MGNQQQHKDVDSASWRGCTMDEIYRSLPVYALQHVSPIEVSEHHTVLYELDFKNDKPPLPRKNETKWDALHVRLPCSAESKSKLDEKGDVDTEKPRWEVIQESLTQPITNSQELQTAILIYNHEFKEKWNFVALHKLFEEELCEEETIEFFKELLPRIIALAFQLPQLIQTPIPLLKQDQSSSLSISQQQVSCLLANAFLCTYPQRNTVKRRAIDPEYKNFPEINFHRLFQSTGKMVLEKIKCLLHYFRCVCPNGSDSQNVPTGVLTFIRKSINLADLPAWEQNSILIGNTLLHINPKGCIEDGKGLLQVDFANKYIGGGVLGSGCVQEEIRFITCTELIISKLFTEFLRPTEALLISGAVQYCNYTGYSNTFKFTGHCDDLTTQDTSRRKMTHVVAIDAMSFRNPQVQYREEFLLRELNKAYSGFLHELKTPPPGIATGNWGCGAYRGDPRLKALLQLMAATVTGRPLAYYTFGNVSLRDDVFHLYELFQELKIRICDLWDILRQYHSQPLESIDLYSFIKEKLKNKN